MSPFTYSLLCLALLAGAIAGGQALRARLPDTHLSEGSETAVRAAVGLLTTLTAIVLGFTVGAARGYYDTVQDGLTTLAAKTRVLDRTLERLGPEAAPMRVLLRGAAGAAVRTAWPGHPTRLPEAAPGTAVPRLEQVQDRLLAWRPEAPRAQALHAQALQITQAMLEVTGTVFETTGSGVQRPLVLALTGWLACIFLGLALLAPPTPTALGALVLGALAATGAILITLEYYEPLRGLVAISPELFERAFEASPPIPH
jgi:hypothetical protein